MLRCIEFVFMLLWLAVAALWAFGEPRYASAWLVAMLCFVIAFCHFRLFAAAMAERSE